MGEVFKVGNIAKIESHKNFVKISDSGVECRTADFIVENSGIDYPCLFEMELFYIYKRFPNIVAYKIVSDNLSHQQFEKFDAKNAWDKLFKIIDANK